ncbi:MAG: DUF1176 domain-containing protein [Alphaproteobacteria bacterium]|nr:DUF1176 domain-containing protein [Alphaproteobacteria bacterium]
MRSYPSILSALVLSLAVFGCDAADTPEAALETAGADPGLAPPSGDAALIAEARRVSDLLGGCERPVDAPDASKIIPLETATIAMVSCSIGPYSYSDRLFVMKEGAPPRLLSLPDYNEDGWFASDQIGMPELDAGTGVLTTLSKAASDGRCGSEGRYAWTGTLFQLQELRWRACDDPDTAGPTFPQIWPTMTGSTVDPNASTPAP